MKAILDLPDSHAEVLISLLTLVPPRVHSWVLTGSCSLRLLGLDIPVYDIDLQTDRESVYAVASKLTDFIKVAVHPWESEHTFSLHAQAEINNVTVELLGGIKHRQPGGEWEPSADILSARNWIHWRENKVPVFSLEFEAQAYDKMGRIEKAKLIRGAIRS